MQIYDPSLVPLLVGAISLLLSPDGATAAVVSATVRNPATLDLFVDTCSKSPVQIHRPVLMDRIARFRGGHP